MQQIIAFGFDAFGQCCGRSLELATLISDGARTLTPAPVGTQLPSKDPLYLGIAATFSCTIAWSKDNFIYIWGLTNTFTGGKNSAPFVRVKVPITNGESLAKVVPSRDSDGVPDENALYVIVGQRLRLMTIRQEESEGEEPSRKRRKTEEDANEILVGSEGGPPEAEFVDFEFSCIDVASTFTTAASITASGTIRTWRHGSPSLQTIIAPSIAQFPYTTISAGLHHFLATTSNGDVYSWGANGLHGQLGGGFRETTERKAPIVIEALQGVKVLGVSAGDTHSAVVSGDGDVYTFGSASHGELGLAENPDVKPGDDADELNHALPTPIDLELPPGRVMVACGSRHTVISDGTRLFGCGWNKYDQLNAVGSDLKKESCGLIPIELRHLAKPPMDQFTIQAVSCGSWHTVVLLEWKSKS